MTSQVTERRLQRAAAQQVFDALALDYLDVADVSRGSCLGVSSPACSPPAAAKAATSRRPGSNSRLAIGPV